VIDRLVEVSATLVGTGWFVTDDIVVTSGHLFEGASRATLRLPGSEPVEGEVVWAAEGDDDIAIVRADDARSFASEVRWGLFRRQRPSAWVGGGFPSAGKGDSVGVSGQIEPFGGLERRMYDLVVQGETSLELWKGLSGGPVLVDGHLIGVIRAGPGSFEGRRLSAVPVSRLLTYVSFRELVGDPVVHPVGRERAETSTLPGIERSSRFWVNLPSLDEELVGRDEHVEWLIEAVKRDDRSIALLHGPAGNGKTAIARKVMDSSSCVPVFGYTFRVQGDDRKALTESDFVVEALRWFRDPDPSLGTAYSPWMRLADLVRRQRCLLVMDGIEAFQDQRGLIQSPVLRSFLNAIADTNQGLCLLTTRVPPASDLGKGIKALEVPELSPPIAVSLLRQASVDGTECELKHIAQSCGHHPLSLGIVASFLRDAWEGRADAFKELDWNEAAQHAGSVCDQTLDGHLEWFGAQRLDLVRALFLALGLFDRPVSMDAIRAVLASDIDGFAYGPKALDEIGLRLAVTHLHEAKLVLLSDDRRTLASHPVVRLFCSNWLCKHMPDAKRRAHHLLCEHLGRSAPNTPNNARDAGMLYHAAWHGCHAGAPWSAFDNIYLDRLREEEGHRIATDGLGMYEEDYQCLLVIERQALALDPADRARTGELDGEMGYDLRALGQLEPASHRLIKACQHEERRNNHADSTRLAVMASYATLLAGQLDSAIDLANEARRLARIAGDLFSGSASALALGRALHYSGASDEAREWIELSETQKKQFEGAGRFVQDFWFCEFWLDYDPRTLDTMERRARIALDLAGSGGKLARRYRIQTMSGRLPIGLNGLTLARCRLLRAADSGDASQVAEASLAIDAASDVLVNEARATHEEPRALLARAEAARLRGDITAAGVIARRGLIMTREYEMKVMNIECELELGRIGLAASDPQAAESHLRRAARAARRIGYGRRNAQLAELMAEY